MSEVTGPCDHPRSSADVTYPPTALKGFEVGEDGFEGLVGNPPRSQSTSNTQRAPSEVEIEIAQGCRHRWPQPSFRRPARLRLQREHRGQRGCHAERLRPRLATPRARNPLQTVAYVSDR